MKVPVTSEELEIRPQYARLPLSVRRHRLVTELDRQLTRLGILSDQRTTEQRVIVGVSGGADSVALLLGSLAVTTRKRTKREQLVPIAVHVHHHLRDAADDDAAWIENLCERVGIELHIEHIYPGNLAGNTSENARTLRYEALLKVARKRDAIYIATAHHADDQSETILMSLCRGAGLDGLSGMSFARPMDNSVTLIRPLLSINKDDCEDVCRAAGIEWREDPTNREDQYARVRVRRDVIPVLEELWPGASSRIGHLSDPLKLACDLVERELSRTFGTPSQFKWGRNDLAVLPTTLIAAGLRRAALSNSPSVTDKLTQHHLRTASELIQCDNHRPRHFHWPGGMTLSVTSKSVTLQRPQPISEELPGNTQGLRFGNELEAL